MQNFEETRRINTNQPIDRFWESLRSQLTRVAVKVEVDGHNLVATRLRTSVGNHPYQDVTRFSLSKSGNGYIVNAKVKFEMTFLVIALLVMGLLTFLVTWIVLILCGLGQSKKVRKEISSIFDVLESEAESMQPQNFAAMSYSQPMMQVAPPQGDFGNGIPDTQFEQPADPIQQVERLGALLKQGLLTQAEFEHQKRRLLGLPEPSPSVQQASTPANKPTRSTTSSHTYYLRRGEKIVGPLSIPKLKEMRSGQKLKASDLVSADPTGPWFKFTDVHKSILDEAKTLPKSKAQ
jgi:hypothetical protein